MSTDDAGRVIEGIDLLGGRRVRLTMQGGRISRIEDLGRGGAGPLLAPGLVDLQVNGAHGADLNAHPLTVETVLSVGRHLLESGTTMYLPAVTTNDPARITETLRVVAAAAGAATPAAGAIGGVHLEGPFISGEDGPRGAHDSRYVRAPDWDLFRRWQDAAGGLVRIVTLAPEWPQATEFIARATAAGVLVAIGHTAATPAQVRDAVRAGATLSTHLGNGAHVQLPRHHNYLWEQLASDDLHAAVIADGAHLPDSMLKVMLRAKRERAVLVSDASSMTGAAPGRYRTAAGRDVELTEDGRLVLASDTALLAASVRLLSYDVAHLVRSGIATLPHAWAMASTQPASLLGLPAAAGLRAGAPADLVVFDWDGDEVRIRQVVKDGHLVWRPDDRTIRTRGTASGNRLP